jgi:Chemotaxis phosphatase CheX
VIPPGEEALAQALKQVLEEAAFVFAEVREAPAPFPGRLLEARLRYRGPQSGELRLVADAGLAATLAANLLGEDEGQGTAARAADALGELLNMLAGAWVARIFGASARCDLGLPAVRELERAEAPARAAPGGLLAHLEEEEGRRIDVSLAAGAAP